MKKLVLSIVAIATTILNAFGQYYYTTSSGNTPGGLNQDPAYPVGNGQLAGWNSILGPSVTTPAWSANQMISFPFNFNGAPVTSYKVSSTGVLTFTTGAVAVPSSTPAALPNAAIPDNSVCAWGLEASGPNDYVSTKTFGTAGSQQEWIHFSSVTNGSIAWSYWSIVLEEGTNNIYVVDQRNSTGTGALTVGIQINGTTAYSDPASPAVGETAGTDFNSADDFYYTFIQGVQPQNEVELVSFDLLSYIGIGAGATNISGSVQNLGSDPITTLTVTWDDGTGPYTDNLTVNILTNQIYNFTSPTQLTSVAGAAYTIDLSVSIAGDADLTNNDATKSTVALTSIPTKYVVGEEKTGTWCGWCPRGAVGLANMESVSEFIGIAVHNGDPMTVASYDGSLGTYLPGGYPGGGVDRVASGNPSAANFLAMHNVRVGATVPCDVKNIVADYDGTTGNIMVSAESEWFGTVSGNYRFSLVIVEDDVIETGSGWLQSNYYDGGGNGTMAFPAGINNGFDFATGGDPADPAVFGGYDHVARYLSTNNIIGDAGSLPAGSVALGVHSHTFGTVAASILNDITKSHAVVMIVNSTTGEILNAGKAEITGDVSVTEIENDLELKLFPNPASDQVNVSFKLQDASDAVITVTDALGNVVMASSAVSLEGGDNYVTINSANLSNGFYFVNVIVGDQVVTQRLSVVH